MAGKALLKDTFREVKRTVSRFASILAIVALGVGFFSGIKATGPDMKLTGDKYFNDTELMDMRLVSTMGFVGEDVEAVKRAKGVKDVIPSYSLDAIYADVESKPVVTVLAITDNVNRPVLKEGRMPEKKNECLAESGGMFSGIGIGDTVHLRSDDGKSPLSDWLENDTYTVVGLVETPLYISYEYGSSTIGDGTVSTFLMIDESNFKSEYYTQLYITAEKPENLSAFDYEYDTLIAGIKERLEGIGEGRIDARYDEVTTKAREELNKNKADFEEARKKAYEELDNAKAELDGARNKLDDGRRKLAEGEKKLLDEEKAGREELDKNRATLDSSLKEYNEQRDKFNTTRESTVKTLESTAKELDETQAILNENRAALNENKAQLNDMRAMLDSGWAQYYDGKNQLENYKKLADGARNAMAFPLFVSDSQLEELCGGLALINSQTALDMREYVTTAKALKVPSLELTRRLTGEINAMYSDIDANNKKLEDSYKELDSYERQYSDGMARINEAESQLDEGDRQIADGRREIENGYAALNDAEKQLDGAKSKIDDGYRQLNDAEKEFRDKIVSAKNEIAGKKAELSDGEKEWSDGYEEYKKGREKAETELADAQSRIKEGEKQIEELKKPKWYFFTRDDNPGYSGFGDDADRMNAIAAVFPVFFILVAALVSLTTMTRMVEEQRTQIGTLKALGYPRSAIMFKFLTYSTLASVLGSVIGSVLGMWLFPTVIFDAYRIIYHMPSVIARFRWDYAVMCTVVAVIGTGAAAIFACYAETVASPAVLMRPRSPKAGKRVLLEKAGFVWKRLSFIQKVTVRNLFRYKRKIFMTVLGIAGCTALMLAGFGIKDSIENIADRQFGAIFKYDMLDVLDDSYDIDDAGKIAENISEIDGVSSVMPLYSDNLKTISTEKVNAQNVMLYVPQKPDKLGEYISLHDRKTEKELPFENGGAVITEKLASLLGIKAGDEITVLDSRQDEYRIRISGVMENYASHFIYMTPDCYREIFGTELKYNMIFTNLTDKGRENQEKISEEILQLDGVLGISGTSNLMEDFDDMIGTLNYVIVVLIFSASALAFVVLYNLSNVNVTERIREIATIKVLGFYDNEVTAYIFRENVVLTVMGIAAGLVMGVLLHKFVIITAEIDTIMFGRNIMPLSYVLAAVLTFLFAGIVSIALHFKLKKVSMVESLKSVE